MNAGALEMFRVPGDGGQSVAATRRERVGDLVRDGLAATVGEVENHRLVLRPVIGLAVVVAALVGELGLERCRPATVRERQDPREGLPACQLADELERAV